jgi:hypothetical protein
MTESDLDAACALWALALLASCHRHGVDATQLVLEAVTSTQSDWRTTALFRGLDVLAERGVETLPRRHHA